MENGFLRGEKAPTSQLYGLIPHIPSYFWPSYGQVSHDSLPSVASFWRLASHLPGFFPNFALFRKPAQYLHAARPCSHLRGKAITAAPVAAILALGDCISGDTPGKTVPNRLSASCKTDSLGLSQRKLPRGCQPAEMPLARLRRCSPPQGVTAIEHSPHAPFEQTGAHR